MQSYKLLYSHSFMDVDILMPYDSEEEDDHLQMDMEQTESNGKL